MIASPVHIKYFTREKALFSEIDIVLENNGLYNIDHSPNGYTLSYWFGEYTFEVGETDYKLLFQLSNSKYGDEIRLHWGDVIVLDASAVSCSWFYFPKLLIGKKEQWIVQARGFTRAGNIFSLVRNGILKRINVNEKPFFC